MNTNWSRLIKTLPYVKWERRKNWFGEIVNKAGLISSLPKRENMLVAKDKNKAPHLRRLLKYGTPFFLISAVSHASGNEVQEIYALLKLLKYMKK